MESDKWGERGEQGQWTRVHRVQRKELFTPFKVPRGPGKKTRLHHLRRTVGVDHSGRRFDITEDWTDKSRSHKLLSSPWTGVTIFRAIAHDDLAFGGDQGRQRERLGLAPGPSSRLSTSTRARKERVSWADISDS